MTAGVGMPHRRHAVGFAVAPLAAPLVFVAIGLVLTAIDGGRAMAPLSRIVELAATRVAPLSYAVALALGVPIVLSLRAARRLSVPWVVAVSTAASAVAVAAVPERARAASGGPS